MKTNLITTKDYLLLIDEEAEIKPDDYIIHDTVDGVIEANDEWDYRGEKDNYWNKVIAFYPLTKEAKELDLPLLPNPFKVNVPDSEYEEGMFGYTEIEVIVAQNAFKEGYKAATKQFSLEDIKKAIEMAREADSIDGTVDLHIVLNFPNTDNSDLRVKWTEEEIIQSLSTQQLPVSFEPGYEYLNCLECEGAGWMLSCSKCRGEGSEKTSKLKVITNSEGKQEIQGRYVY